LKIKESDEKIIYIYNEWLYFGYVLAYEWKWLKEDRKKWKRIKSIENVEKEKEWESIHRERVRVCVSEWLKKKCIQVPLVFLVQFYISIFSSKKFSGGWKERLYGKVNIYKWLIVVITL